MNVQLQIFSQYLTFKRGFLSFLFSFFLPVSVKQELKQSSPGFCLFNLLDQLLTLGVVGDTSCY